jgi:hypothetical protein
MNTDGQDEFKDFPLGECLLTSLAMLAVLLAVVALIDWVYG